MVELEGYEPLEVLGESGTAVLLRARPEGDGASVVIKLLKSEHPTPEEVARIHREYRIARDLDLDGVVHPRGVQRFKHRVGLILEDFGGTSLRSTIGPTGMPTETFLHLAIPLARTLGQLHDADVIHKDLNPSNIVVDEALTTVKITDFGIATRLPRLHREAKTPDRLEGTLAYLSPEQTGRMNRAVDHRSDFYALGATFYEMLTGRPPFPAQDAMELVHCHIAVRPLDPAEVDPAIPRALSSIVLKLLGKAPEDRYQSAYGLVRDLEACLEQWETTGQIEPFPLGSQDISSRFQLPERLYGRQTEIASLTEGFERAAAGAALLALLSGSSGTGKSALARELQPLAVERQGYFISGKFDQYSGSVPYASLIDAFRELVRQLLGEPPERIAAWRQAILEALGGNAGVVAEVIPDVKLITGDLPAVAVLGPIEAQNRFNLVFRQFIGVFTRPEHPLVVFLDDLHWADVDSLRLLRTLVADPDASHLLVVGAYRPEAVGADHPLTQAIGALDAAQSAVVELGPLPLEAVTQLVADMLGTSPVEAASLAGLVHERTGGNPFFVGQFLLSLFEDDLIHFAADRGRWIWNLAGIRRRGMTDNVVELVAGKVGELPPATQEALRIAAVAGNTFDLATVAPITGRSPAAMAAALDPAIHSGLVLPLGETHELIVEGLDVPEGSVVSYRFLHDRVQQACYSAIPEDEVPAVHRRIGELFLERLRRHRGDDDLFEVVVHLNAGIDVIPEGDGRRELAQLNLEAARKARTSNAFESAAVYLRTGLSLLGETAWTSAYEIAFELHLLQGQVLAVLGQVDDADSVFETVLQRARSVVEKAICCDLRSEALHGAGRAAEGYAAGRAGLELVGVHLPSAPEEVAEEAQRLMAQLLDAPTVDRFHRLEEGDEHARLVGRLFWRAVIGAYHSAPADLGLVVGKNVDQMLRTGLVPQSSTALALLGFIAVLQGHLELGIAYAEAAVAMADRFTDPYERGRALLVAWILCLVWKHPFEVSERALLETASLCHSTGDLEFTNHALLGVYISALMPGRDCGAILERCQQFLDHCVRSAPIETGQARIRVAALQQLMGREVEPVDFEAIIHQYEEEGNVTDVCESFMERARLETLFGDYAAAYADAARAEPDIDAGGAGTLLFNYLFRVHYVVAGARLAAITPDTAERAAYLAKVDGLLEKVTPVAEFNPDNFGSYATLAAAERARAVGDTDEATVQYLQTIEHAGIHGYVLLEAFANELLARLYQERGLRFAAAHLQEARALYLECGAGGKALALEEEFPELLQGSRVAKEPLSLFTTPTTDRGPAQLDLTTALKASQAIAGEITVERVVARLIAISIENAGAERGVFVSVDGEDVRVEAEGRAGSDDVRVHPSVPLDVADGVVPPALVRSVARTGEPVVLADAEGDARSVLVLPIIRKGEITGVLYLENTLVAGAFTPERLALLEVLSGQMAISLEIARLYSHLEEKVAERTGALSDALEDLRGMQRQMVESEKLAALGGLVAGVAHEINTPVGIAVTAASHLVDRTAEFRSQWTAGPLKRSALERFIEAVEDSGRLILDNLQRSNDLVQSFKQVAVDQSSEARRTFTVRSYLDDILRSLRPRLKRTTHLIDIDADADLTITSYPGALAQVVTNLVLNSVVHAYAEGESGRLRLEAAARDGGVRIVYSDDGSGIPADILERIFDPFFSTRRSHGGSGLGLHIVYNLVTQRLGGTVAVQSEPGTGTSFTIDIPEWPDGR
jgi:predicted ATPase/signal transduction histidine kinase